MEPLELIAELERNATEGDEITRRLIDALKERHAAAQDLFAVEENFRQQRILRAGVIAEAAFAIDDMKPTSRRQRWLTRMLFGIPQ